jgi:hypothetical protein
MWVEFNVPPSNGDCSINAPPIEDQFPIVAFIFANEGWGNDWAVMAPGTNNLGQTIFDRYGEFRPIAGTAPSPGDPLALWGFGIDPPQCEESSTQQTSGGSVTSVSSLFLSHDVDATHGCSGAGLIRDGEIVGIATHCPCPNRQILGGPLPHDGCADAIPATEGLIAFNTTNATTDGSPHVGDCQFDGQTYHDIWYEYLALCDGILTVTTCEELGGSATYDTDLVVYDGCSCDSLVLVGCNDDDGINPCGGSPGYHSTVQVSVVSGHCYKIRVGGYSEGDVGVGMLHISLEPALANNDCLNAVVRACSRSTQGARRLTARPTMRVSSTARPTTTSGSGIWRHRVGPSRCPPASNSAGGPTTTPIWPSTPVPDPVRRAMGHSWAAMMTTKVTRAVVPLTTRARSGSA